MYRAPDSHEKVFRNKYENLVIKDLVSENQFFVNADININSLDYETKNIVKIFFSASFENGMFPVVTRPTRVKRHTSTVIEHILTNSILTKNISSGIVETNISDHFPIFSYRVKEIIFDTKRKKTIFKRKINDQCILTFKYILSNCDWEALHSDIKII